MKSVIPSTRLTQLKSSLLAASLISGIGDQIYLFTVPLYLLDHFGSTALASGVRAAEVVASAVGSIYLGHVLDRVGNRRLTVQLTFVLLLLGGCLSVLTLLGIDLYTLPPFIVLTLAIMGFSRVYSISFQNAMPLLLDRTGLVAFNARMGTIMTVVSVVGVGVAGMLYGLLPMGVLMLLNAASFACFLLPARALPDDLNLNLGPSTPMWPSYIEAVRHIWASRDLTYMTTGFLVYTMVTASSTIYTIFSLKQHFHYSAQAIGVALFCAHIGGLLGSSSATGILKRLGSVAGFRISVMTGCILVGFLGISPTSVQMVAVLSGVLFCTYVANVAHVSLRQMASTVENRGRVLGLISMLLRLAAPLGLLVFGTSETLIGRSASFMLSGVFGLVILIILGRRVSKRSENV